MIFNGSSRIKDNGGDYLVLVDYGSEGLSVSHQFHTHTDALGWMAKNNTGYPNTLVKLVRVDILECEEAIDKAKGE